MSRVVALTSQQSVTQNSKDIVKFCRKQMKACEVSQTQVADYLGISQNAVSKQISPKSKHVSMELFIAVMKLTDPDGEVDLRRLIK